jgi:hypothetical protein
LSKWLDVGGLYTNFVSREIADWASSVLAEKRCSFFTEEFNRKYNKSEFPGA